MDRRIDMKSLLKVLAFGLVLTGIADQRNKNNEEGVSNAIQVR